jgi:hypothetical protein
MKKTLFARAMSLAYVAAASASTSAPMNVGTAPLNPSVVKVGEGCGPNSYRGPDGLCHRFTGRGGTNRGTAHACPPNMHVGPGGARCYPNR